MAIEIKGREIQLNNEVIITKNGKGYALPRKVPPLRTKAPLSPERFALVQEGELPNFNSRMAISMEQMSDGLKYQNAIISALKWGFTVPSTSPFMQHYVDVNDASNGKGVLYDASGDLIEGTRLTNYVNALNSKYYVNLNAKFVEGSGFLDLDLETIMGIDPDGAPIFSRVPLERCFEKDGMIDLQSLNSQGFPTEKSTFKDYVPGRVIMFYRPVEDRVAWFDADSYWDNLDCYGGPALSGASLGVRVARENLSEGLESIAIKEGIKSKEELLKAIKLYKSAKEICTD